MIIAVIMAIAAPSLRGFTRGARLRDVAADFVATTQLARLNAATTASTHRITLGDEYGWALTSMQGDQFVNVDIMDARPDQPLPEGYRVQIMDLNNAPLEAIEFYPTARVTPARVRITNPEGNSIDIEAVAPTDAFHITTPGGER